MGQGETLCNAPACTANNQHPQPEDRVIDGEQRGADLICLPTAKVVIYWSSTNIGALTTTPPLLLTTPITIIIIIIIMGI